MCVVSDDHPQRCYVPAHSSGLKPKAPCSHLISISVAGPVRCRKDYQGSDRRQHLGVPKTIPDTSTTAASWHYLSDDYVLPP